MRHVVEWFLELHPSIQAAFVSAGAALLGAFLGVLAAHFLRRVEDGRNRRIELVGLLELLNVETAHNTELLEKYESNAKEATDEWRSTLRTDV